MYMHNGPARYLNTIRRLGAACCLVRSFGHACGSIVPGCWERNPALASMVAANLHTAVIVNASALPAPLERNLCVLRKLAAGIDDTADDGAKVPGSRIAGVSRSVNTHMIYTWYI